MANGGAGMRNPARRQFLWPVTGVAAMCDESGCVENEYRAAKRNVCMPGAATQAAAECGGECQAIADTANACGVNRPENTRRCGVAKGKGNSDPGRRQRSKRSLIRINGRGNPNVMARKLMW